MTDDLKARLRTAALMLPIRREDNADYAEVFGQDFQAMTMTPERFEALSALPEALARIEALEVELVKARRIIKGWADWHRMVEDDPKDDLPYLNGKAWDDAEALADNSKTFLRRAALAGGGDE